ncbi:hypothetical protein Hdeb2414_s0380g00881101 [Helianthus debilis subsp. tardiflorus]
MFFLMYGLKANRNSFFFFYVILCQITYRLKNKPNGMIHVKHFTTPKTCRIIKSE